MNDPEQTPEMENQLAVFEISNDVMNNTIWNLVSPHTHELDSGKCGQIDMSPVFSQPITEEF